jgi:uncharacterized protein YjbI with pentapeptide repeats
MTPPNTARGVPRIGEDLASESPPLRDETRITEVTFAGDYSGVEAALVDITGCRLDHRRFTGGRLSRWRLADCVAISCDFSGVTLEECSFRRVEFRDCRFSGVQAQHSSFKDVGFIDCKADEANFRMTTWERTEFEQCDLSGADFYGAQLPGTRFSGCRLNGVQLARADLAGSHFHGSSIEGVQGAESLRSVTIGSDLVIPVALALFATLEIRIDDETVEN